MPKLNTFRGSKKRGVRAGRRQMADKLRMEMIGARNFLRFG